MLRIAKLTDYGIVVMAHLARTAHVCVHPAAEVAEATGVPMPTVQKVLKALAREGMLLSTRGAHGGYSLARDPAQVSVLDVVEALEGPMALTACALHEGEVCADEPHCDVAGHWPRINGAVRHALSQVSLLELSRPVDARPVARRQLAAGRE